MSNMSYCRFENTLSDLVDCVDNMGSEPDSTDEQRARKKLIRLCVEVSNDYGSEVEE